MLLSTQMTVSLAFCAFSRDYLRNPFAVPQLSPALMLSATPMALLGVANVGAGLMYGSREDGAPPSAPHCSRGLFIIPLSLSPASPNT